jgi:protein SCO1
MTKLFQSQTARRLTFERALVISLLLFSSLVSLSCGPQQPQASPDARRYELKGKVVAVDKAERRVTVAHEEIAGYMEAMTMPFALRQNDYWALDILEPGQTLSATLVVDGGLTWVENIVVTQESVGATTPASKTDAPREAQPGEAVPNFTLINQDGRPIRLEQYRGRVLLLTFIYTRCPLPDYCPLMNSNFAAVDKELKKTAAVYDKTHLLSVSFDTEYDTPKVLKSYGAALTENYTKETFSHWEFATGASEEIRRLGQFFGLTYYKESNQIVHGLRTAVITPEGKIFKVYRGNDWKPEELLRDIRTILEQK